MFFKKAIAFEFTGPGYSTVDWEEKLSAAAFQPCSTFQSQSQGFVPPAGHLKTYVHEVMGSILIAFKIEERLLPEKIVRERLAEKVAEFEEKTLRSPGRIERQNMKEALVHEMLPQAFTHSKTIHALLNFPYFYVNGSAKETDTLLTALRKALETLPVRCVDLNQSVSAVMTLWAQGQQPLPDGLVIMDKAKIKSYEGSKTLTVSNSDELCADIEPHLCDMQVAALSLDLNDGVRFTLNDEMHLNSLKFIGDGVDEAAKHEDQAARFDAEVVIMSGLFDQIMLMFSKAFGFESGFYQEV